MGLNNIIGLFPCYGLDILCGLRIRVGRIGTITHGLPKRAGDASWHSLFGPLLRASSADVAAVDAPDAFHPMAVNHCALAESGL